eukprot:CAMPEP_0195055440 /NCGR_PEP_ID=MMETSP0448-20130528/4106_1 /TAXON_ID=66468 /ORGANISM="Heterocapsa triquestra, Strain CCMP 448" /LENGTH=32 /DNA_ID= /DNA_START= /DNA_END= /DNA_ORIENTATION=
MTWCCAGASTAGAVRYTGSAMIGGPWCAMGAA